MLCQEAIIEWRKIYEKKTRKRIGFEEATDKANKMFKLLKTVAKHSSCSKLKHGEGVKNNGTKIKG